MRLFDAIIDANHRAVSGDASAVVHVHEYPDELPVVGLTCIDPRLNPMFPAVLGLPTDKFIWLRNAGNIVTGPASSTIRSIALACAVKGGREIAVIGHSDCQVGKTSAADLLEKLRRSGVDRQSLPQNLSEFFGIFSSERHNVIKAVEFIRKSPLIGPKVVVHGFLVDTGTGRLEWLVNGYQAIQEPAPAPAAAEKAEPVIGGPHASAAIGSSDFHAGEFKIGGPLSAIGGGDGQVGSTDTKIGDVATKAVPVTPVQSASVSAGPSDVPPVQAPPRRGIPVPPPIRPRIVWQRRRK
jgi:carbonic anhydrase